MEDLKTQHEVKPVIDILIKDLQGFILNLRWHYMHNKGIRNIKKLRVAVAEDFRNDTRYKSGKWTVETFVDVWNYMQKNKMIK